MLLLYQGSRFSVLKSQKALDSSQNLADAVLEKSKRVLPNSAHVLGNTNPPTLVVEAHMPTDLDGSGSNSGNNTECTIVKAQGTRGGSMNIRQQISVWDKHGCGPVHTLK